MSLHGLVPDYETVVLRQCAVLLVCLSLIYLNTLGPRQNGGRLADDIFKCIFFNEKFWILDKISPKYVA